METRSESEISSEGEIEINKSEGFHKNMFEILLAKMEGGTQ